MGLLFSYFFPSPIPPSPDLYNFSPYESAKHNFDKYISLINEYRFNEDPYYIYSLTQDWVDAIELSNRYIDDLCVNNEIPAGTLIYHGTLDPKIDFNNLNKDIATFFGIAPNISIWYLYEMVYDRYRGGPQYGYVHVFEVERPIPIIKISDLFKHPKRVSACRQKDVACIHPQVVFHGSTDAPKPYEISIELTMNLKHYISYIKHVKCLTINIEKLQENRYKYPKYFNYEDAIVSVTNGGKHTRRKKMK